MKISKNRRLHHFYYLNDACRKRSLYKYMTMETALECLENGTLRFVEPVKWPDQFEGLYYKAKYTKVDPADRVPKKLVACCLAQNKACEAAWNQYTYEGKGLSSLCVQFVMNRKELQGELDKYAVKEDMKVYEGLVDYSHDDFTIENIKSKKNALHDVFFKDFSLVKYLNILLLKRKLFYYESEVRLFLINNDQTHHVDTRDVPINWGKVLKKILLTSKASKWEEKLFTDYVHSKYPGIPIEKVNILAAPTSYDYEIED